MEWWREIQERGRERKRVMGTFRCFEVYSATGWIFKDRRKSGYNQESWNSGSISKMHGLRNVWCTVYVAVLVKYWSPVVQLVSSKWQFNRKSCMQWCGDRFCSFHRMNHRSYLAYRTCWRKKKLTRRYAYLICTFHAYSSDFGGMSKGVVDTSIFGVPQGVAFWFATTSWIVKQHTLFDIFFHIVAAENILGRVCHFVR